MTLRNRAFFITKFRKVIDFIKELGSEFRKVIDLQRVF